MKKEISAEKIYRRNQILSRVFKILAPIVFWGCLAVSVLCLFFAIKNSLGNVAEICDLLDNSKWTGEELSNNYNMLIEKYGEWLIGNGGNGFEIKFINIAKAVFTKLMIANASLSVLFFGIAYILGKLILPKLAVTLLNNNQDMVNLTILKNQK